MQVIILDQVEQFLSALSTKELAKAIRVVELLEDFGNNLGMPHSKYIETSLLELRIRGKREIRIFYSFHRKQAFLLHGFIKKAQQTPQKELQAAKAAKAKLAVI